VRPSEEGFGLRNSHEFRYGWCEGWRAKTSGHPTSLRQTPIIAFSYGHLFQIELFQQRHEDAPHRSSMLTEVAQFTGTQFTGLIVTPAPPLPEHEIQLSLCPRRSATIPRRWWDHPLLSPASLTFRFPASALVNSSSRTFASTRSGALAMGAEIAVIKAQAVAFDSSVPHDGVI